MVDREVLRKLLEAALFAAGRPVSDEEIKELLGNVDVEGLVEEINESLEGHPFHVVKEYGGWFMTLKEGYLEKVSHFYPVPMLSRSEMRTLAVIAANEPVLLSDLVTALGGSARRHVKKLKRLGLIREIREGRKKVLRTTTKFAHFFKLGDADDSWD